MMRHASLGDQKVVSCRFFNLAFSVWMARCVLVFQAQAGEELLTDPGLTCGLTVMAPTTRGSTPIMEGKIQPDESCRTPAWRLAQWSSHTTLAGAKAERSDD